jgi:hypothetical protein
VAFLEAWRRAPAAIPRPLDVLAMLAAERAGGSTKPGPGSGWRTGEEHQWSGTWTSHSTAADRAA